MVVGISYDLKDDYIKSGFSEEDACEFDKLETIDAIENTLNLLGYETVRIGNLSQLVLRLGKGERWDMVFNICEGVYGIGREAQVPALLEAYKIPFTFSDAFVMALTLHKGMTKRVIRDSGIATPDFAIIENEEDIEKVELSYPLFVKPIAEGTGKGISNASKINDKKHLTKVCLDLIKKFKQPVLIETYLPGREFTVGIIGNGKMAEAIGVLEVLLNEKAEKHAYSYINKDRYEEFVEYKIAEGEIAEGCKKIALAAWRELGCRDAGRVDVKLDINDKPNFLEVNPLAGINPIHSDLPILASRLGITYVELIRKIMASAIERYKLEDR